MKQPELGRKITELRKQRGFTQEELAYRSRLNVRSIQRVESGEVTPRLSTLKLLSEVLEFELNSEGQADSNPWLLLMHLSSVIPIVIIPLIIWIWKRDELPEIESHGIDVLNFQISMSIYLFAASMLVFVVIGLLILPALGIFIFFVAIINTIKVALEQDYRYPLSIRFF
ncbi:MAG: DUF4870 domain-containing protein [bacterium]